MIAIFMMMGFACFYMTVSAIVPLLVGAGTAAAAAAPVVAAGVGVASALDEPDVPDLPPPPDFAGVPDEEEVARNAARRRRQQASLQSLRIEPGRAGGGSGLRI